MAKLFNRAKMTTATTGSGTVTLGSASNGFQTFAAAGVLNGDVVQYVIEEGANFEIGTGTYSSTGTSLTRSPTESSNSNNAITLAGQATVSITAVADDLNRLQHGGSDKVTVSSTGASVTGNLAVSGTVDGRDVASDGSKLDGIESGATADQTAAQIRAKVEAASDSNVFTDADHSKLNGIEAGATGDQTNAEIRAAVEAATDSNVFTDADHTKLNGIEANAKNDQTITAGGGLTGGGTGDVTISHADTSSQASVNGSGRTYIQDITLDTYGHVTGLATATETVVNTDTNTNQLTTFQVEDGDGTEVTISHGKEWKFTEAGGININWTDTSTGSDGDPFDLSFNVSTSITAGGGLTGGGALSSNRTISHADTSSQASVNNSGRTYIQDITLDTYGHITGITSATETVVNTDTNTTNFNVQANGGTQVNISAGEEINFINGNATTAAVTNQANPTVTFHHNDTSSQGSVNNSGGTVIQDVTLDGYGHVTGLTSYNLDGRYFTESESDGRFVRKGVGYTWTAIGASALSFRSTDAIDTATGDQAALEVVQDTAGADAFMQFHVQGDYAKYFGLHGGINDFVVGGWSHGASYQRLFHDGYHPNADKWTTARTLSLTGDVTGSVSWDGSGNASLSTTVGNDSHSHSNYLTSNVDDSLTAAIVVPTGNRDEGIFGTYDSYKTQHIWSMGTSYRNAANGANFGNMYGLSYYHPNNGNGTMASSHQTVHCINGSPKVALGTNIWTSGSIIVGGTVDGVDIAARDGVLTTTTNTANAALPKAGGTVTGTLTLSQDGQDVLHFSANDTNDNRGIAFNSRTALSADYNDGWLRLNNGSEFSNGIYTPANLRVDGTLTVASKIIHTSDSDTYLDFNTTNSWRVVTGNTEGLKVAGVTVDVPSQIRHTGDTDTYMQFHNANEWRVVVGGSERLEVKNSSPHVLVSGDLNSTSDERLKKNIKPIDNALADICQLEGVTFDWRDTGTQGQGFIAQQVEPIIPDVVNTDEDTGMKSINYVGLIGHLVEAIKTQQTQIDDLKAEIQSMKS